MKAVKKLLSDKSISDVLIIFAISRLLILFTGYLSSLIIIKGEFFNQPIVPRALLDLFCRWDSGWYGIIVKYGYAYHPESQSSVAFFPLFPLIVKVFTFILRDPMIAGFVVSNAAFIFAGIYLHRLISVDYKDQHTASRAVLYMMIFPATFFFSVPYAEGLFILLATASFYYAIKQKWLTASILGFFLSLTRVPGVLILIPLLVEYFLNSQRIKKDMLWLSLIPLGLILYMSYTYLRFGDALAFYHAASAWKTKIATIFATLNSLNMYDLFYRIIFLGAIGAAAILTAYLIYFKARISYAVYCLVFLAAYLSTNILEGMPRYIIVLFPMYLSLSLIGGKSRFLDVGIILFLTTLLVLFTVLFTNGYWLA